MSGTLSVREGKGAKDRTLWVGEEVLQELREWTERRRDQAKSSNYLLPTRKGTEVATSHLRRSVKRYARKAENLQNLNHSSRRESRAVSTIAGQLQLGWGL